MTNASQASDARAFNKQVAEVQIATRLSKVERSISESVKLIAVTKTFSADIVRAAYACGIRDFAENKIQEAIKKQSALSDLTGITWHFIGHIQSNKSRRAVEHFDWIHSVDSLKLATRMDKQAAEIGKRVSCCLQVKLASDPNKDGFEKSELLAALPQLDTLTHLDIQGLMTIPPYGLSAAKTTEIFAAARSLAAEIADRGLSRVQMNQLSMGMSGDFELAIAQGATMIRLGSILFGSRHS